MDSQAPEPLKVYVVAENRLYREAVTEVLASRRGLMVVGQSAPQEMRGDELRGSKAAIILVDAATPDSVAALKAIAPASPAKIVALSVAEVESEVIAYAEAGVAGFVSRNASLSDLLATIESVASDEMPLSPKIAASLIRRVAALAADRPATPGLQVLTAREREIIELVDEGLSNKA